MTICIASIGGNSTILGASDRMMTADTGNIQFEPPQPKIWQITSSIALMIAGDLSIHSMIYQETRRIVLDLISKAPTNWLKVKDVAEIYNRAYYDLLLKQSEKEILWPLGLTKDTFIKLQKEMASDLVNEIYLRLSKFSLRDIGAIITGNDGDTTQTTPHIYVIENGNIECNDDIGFAAIGAGYWHANSQFMFSKYTKFDSDEKQLLNTFWAKKRAEVASGVGKETDMFVIGNQLGSFFRLPPKFIKEMEKMYEKHCKEINVVEGISLKTVKEYLETLTRPPQQVDQEASKDNLPKAKPEVKVGEKNDDIKK